MAPADFVRDVLSDARSASTRTGVPTSVILAQWGIETGWGSSTAWQAGHNYAGIGPGRTYASRAAGLDAYVHALLAPAYAPVRSAGSADAAARALGASPWDSGHYGGGGATLLSVMASNGLTQYDAGGGAPTDPAGWHVPGTPWDVPSPSDAAGAVAGKVVDLLVSALRKPVLTGLFLAGGAVLVVTGAVRAVEPRMRRQLDEAGPALEAAAVAG